MNNVNEIPVDVEEMRHWINGYRLRREEPMKWPALAKETGIGQSTLQAFCKDSYVGNNENVARQIYAFMQSVKSRMERSEQLPTDPGYIETPTSLRMRSCISLAHDTGGMSLIAAAPGTGKTKTNHDYQNRARPVWVVTMMPSTSKVNPMIGQVQSALNMSVSYGNSASASRAVMAQVDGRKGLLIVDEAQNMIFDSFEEIRGWVDNTDLSVCFMGNTGLLSRIESGRQSDDFAQFNRRLVRKMAQALPLVEDVAVFCDAWKIEDPAIRNFLTKVARTPRAGGLGECAQLIKTASMLAASDERGLEIADFIDAQSTRVTRLVKS